MNADQQLPAWLAAQVQQPAALQPLAPPVSLGRYLLVHYGARVAPLAISTGVLVLARWWHAEGAAHSTWDAVLMGVLATASAGAGTVNGLGQGHEYGLTMSAYGAAGALAVTGVAAYSNGMALPLIMWALASGAAYAVCSHFWRQDRRQERADQHVLTVEQLRSSTTVTTTVVTAMAAVEVAKTAALAQAARADALEEAWAARRALEPGFTTDAAGFRRLELTAKESDHAV